jgi:ribosomal protein S18 acetylase RimI-like enzyme
MYLLSLRKAEIGDHEFLIRVDLLNDGYSGQDETEMTQQEKEDHRLKILKFITDQDKGAYVFVDSESNKQIGTIMYHIRNRDIDYPWKPTFNELDRNLFQSDGRFMEIFQLWVHPKYRRLGLATKLKLKIEEDARHHKVNLIYTHTEGTNPHVVSLNKKLGYEEIWRGPVQYETGVEVIRVCLIKHLF